MDTNSKLKKLKASGHLPSPKGAAMQVLLLSQMEDVTNQQIAHAIQADPALSSRLIKLANSPAAHQVRPIISVVDAVAVLGMNTVRQMVLALSLVDSSRSLVCRYFDYQDFWSHSLLTAIAAQNLVLSRNLGSVSPEEIFVLGLLANVGSLALATANPQEYSGIYEQCLANSEVSLIELEQKQFGFDHNLLSKEMLADWRMPEVFQRAVLHYEDPSRSTFADGSRDWNLVHLLHIADFLASMCLAQEPARSKMISKLIFKATRLGVESDVLTGLGDKVVKEWHDWSKLFNIRVVDVPPFEKLLEVAPLVPDSSDAGELPKNLATTFKLRILLVDDDRAVLMVIKMLLDNLGHTVALARNGVEALTMVKDFMPQVIMTDWIMPQMDGIEFCKALRRNPEWRNIYVFILTAQESTDRLVEAFEAGANDYMTKPINPKVLGARLSAGQRVVQLQEELEYERQLLHKFSSELAVSNQRLQQLALTDELTGLPNRRFANEHLERQWAMAQRNNSQLSCMMLDIDFFKQVNDTYGHKTGDDVLKQVASELQASVRKQDVVCRLGGEEFLVICPDAQAAESYRYAERIREKIAALVFNSTSGKKFQLTVSIGTASKKPVMFNAEMLLQLADKRLYEAKESGRNRTVAD
jgi:diguanylate cyclase (GGDEF)-like protein